MTVKEMIGQTNRQTLLSKDPVVSVNDAKREANAEAGTNSLERNVIKK